jgi:hypothetical protein
MKGRQWICLAAALWWGGVAGEAQTVVGVGQGGTGASTPAAARQKLGAAAEVHTHPVTDLNGVTGKSGSGSVLLTFGGGAAAASTCAMFDAAGNVVSTGQSCGSESATGTTFSQSFTNTQIVTLSHGLGTKSVVMACYDAQDRLVDVHTARVPTEDLAEVTFATPQSGRCVVQGAGGVQGSGAVTSVFGREGAVVATTGDYSFGQIAGVADLAQGGTNQSGWTAGRCVQVAADGSRLESAAAACGAGGGESTVVSNSGAGVQILKPGTNVTGRTLVAGANVTLTQETDTIWIAATGGGGSVETGTGLLGSGSAVDPVRVNPALVPTFVSNSATVNDWGTIAASTCAQKSLDLPGAVSSDAVIPRWPAGLPAGLTGTMYVAGAEAVTVRICNPTANGIALPNGHQFGATILRSF